MSAGPYELYQRLPGLVLGFHGCDSSVGELVLAGPGRHLVQSNNEYDWLGPGIYFWENDPTRALEFATAGAGKPRGSKGHIAKPFVLGAVIDLRLCLNLLSRPAADEAAVAFSVLQAGNNARAEPMPVNKGLNMGARYLDRAVIQTVHEVRLELAALHPGDYAPYDSVRAAFFEGDELYEGAGFAKKNHIQLAIRDQGCIKGYFRPFE